MKRNNKIAQMTKKLMKDKNITDITELQSTFKKMLKNGVEALLEAELDNEFCYEKYINYHFQYTFLIKLLFPLAIYHLKPYLYIEYSLNMVPYLIYSLIFSFLILQLQFYIIKSPQLVYL